MLKQTHNLTHKETKLGLILGEVKKKGPDAVSKQASALLARWKRDIRDSGEKRKRETPTKSTPTKKAALNCTALFPTNIHTTSTGFQTCAKGCEEGGRSKN